MIKRLSGTLSGVTPRINIRMPSARSGTTAAAGTGSDQVSRLDKLKQGIINNKKKIAAVTLVSGSLAAVSAQQTELIDDAERLKKKTDTKCDAFGTSNLFKDCIKQCPVKNEGDPCIVHNGCYNKDENGEPIYKDVYLKDKCLEDLLKEKELTDNTKLDVENKFLEENIQEMADLDDPILEPIPIETESTLDNSDSISSLKNTAASFKNDLLNNDVKSIQDKINVLKNKKKEVSDPIKSTSAEASEPSEIINTNDGLYNKINEYMDPKIFGFALLIIVWLSYQLLFTGPKRPRGPSTPF